MIANPVHMGRLGLNISCSHRHVIIKVVDDDGGDARAVLTPDEAVEAATRLLVLAKQARCDHSCYDDSGCLLCGLNAASLRLCMARREHDASEEKEGGAA